MVVTNHVLAGAAIALAVDNPLAAIPLALISHFVLDAFPHFGYPGRGGYQVAFNHPMTQWVAAGSATLLLAVVMILLLSGEVTALIIGFIAASPDVWGLVNYYVYEKQSRVPDKYTRLIHLNFHRRIQLFERPWGLAIEGLVFVTLVMMTLNLASAQ